MDVVSEFHCPQINYRAKIYQICVVFLWWDVTCGGQRNSGDWTLLTAIASEGDFILDSDSLSTWLFIFLLQRKLMTCLRKNATFCYLGKLLTLLESISSFQNGNNASYFMESIARRGAWQVQGPSTPLPHTVQTRGGWFLFLSVKRGVLLYSKHIHVNREVEVPLKGFITVRVIHRSPSPPR